MSTSACETESCSIPVLAAGHLRIRNTGFFRWTPLLLMLGFIWGDALVWADELPALTERVRTHIEYLASEELAGRRGPDSTKAAEYVRDEFARLGLQPVFAAGSFFQEIPGPKQETGEPTFIGKNVAGLLPGTDPARAKEYLLIAAHHDHLGKNKSGIFAGADDNASGVAMVIEVARLLGHPENRPARPILFVSFDLEEHLLFGSRWFAAHPPLPLEQIKFVLVADMLGRSLGDMPVNSVFLFGCEHGSGIRETIAHLPFGNSCRPVLLSDDFVGTRSDYGPFRDRQIPFVFVSTGQSRDYHTIRDRAEKIDFQQVAEITQSLAELMKTTAQQTEPPVWIEQPEMSLQEVSAVLKIVEAIEQQADQWKLTPLQRLFVAQTRRQAEKILRQQQLLPADRDWLTRTTQLLLFSVF